MKNFAFLICCLFSFSFLNSQTNIKVTNTDAAAVLAGNFMPSDYLNGGEESNPKTIIAAIQNGVHPDSLKKNIIHLAGFRNRNTGSDTVSTTEGMGAARRWVYREFQRYSAENGLRLIPSYLQFDRDVCGMGHHRNIMAVLPGTDAENHGVVLIEGHMDSRCEDNCDVNCVAEGVEDNATGTALVMELARVMSKFAYKHTIVFMVTTGEEQGLIGATAFADYCFDNNVPIKAVLNNDVIGGIICGKTSSPPSCPGENEIDSTQVRLFSSGSLFSKHKQLARYIKLEYQEELLNQVEVPMMLTIMSSEDRAGRGGDHIPFRIKNFAAMRFTSANEHGDGAPDPDYTDRQHTMDDILGADTDNDGEVDSFFVDFNYLARNAVINGNAAACIAQGNPVPEFETSFGNGNVIIDVADGLNYDSYRVAVRSRENDFDTIYTFQGNDNFLFPIPASGTTFLFVSVAGVDANGIESCFTAEVRPTLSGTKEPEENTYDSLELLQNIPNPFDEATYITYNVKESFKGRKGWLVIRDLNGKEIKRERADLNPGFHEILYTHGYNATGTFIYSIEIDGQIVASRSMIFNN
ncbi:MAG: M28 family peptidase [Saprospiraceae bacterium]